MTHETLQVIWFILLAVLFIGYAVLDGFDLGAGFWHLFAKTDGDKRTILNAIGPFWDGNEVWLLSGGGATFAAFPPVYATMFSGFYVALVLLLACLILRAVAIEYRSKATNPRAWDLAFGIGSTLVALLMGVAFANILRGIPLDAEGNFTGNFFTLLNPYSVVIGVVSVAMLATHGALWIAMKSDALAATARGWASKAWSVYLVLAFAALVLTPVHIPRLLANFQAAPALWAVPVLIAVAVVLIGVFNAQGKTLAAFLASSVGIAGFIAGGFAAQFPRIIPAENLSYSLTIANSSSQYTLTVMLIIALIGVPIVLGYTAYIYRILGGKVTPDTLHY
jgi:cytochrome d ubiquinol oxidase subunit II